MRTRLKLLFAVALCACGSQDSPRTSLLLAASTSFPVAHSIGIFVSVQGEPVRTLQLMRGDQAIASLAPPFEFTWETTNEIEGSHVLYAVATNASGQKIRSNALEVIVDRTGPQVAQVVPAPGLASATSTSLFAVTFSEPILRSTAGPDSAVLQEAAGTRIPAEITLSPDGRTLVVTPSPPLAPQRRSISLHVAATLTDRAGNALRAPSTDFAWSLAGVPLGARSLQYRFGTNGVELSWQPPTDDGGAPIATYRVRQYAGTVATELLEMPSPSTTLWWIGLQNHRTVVFAVAAANAIGEGPEIRTPPVAISYEEPVLAYHRVAPLPSGKVLVVGGTDGRGFVPATLYDPATGTMSPAGPGELPRQGSTVARLGDGRVLIAGGYGADSRTAQIYDPVRNRFTSTAPLLVDHVDASGAELPDGRVLIAGGIDSSSGAFKETAAAEIYDPAKGTFARTESMIQGRIAPASAVLPGGKVLVAGGWLTSANNSIVATSAAEVWDPATGRFALTGSLSVPRALATATTLADGRVLVVGFDWSIEIYDPATGRFTIVGRTLEFRNSHTATLLADGRVLIAGGSSPDPGAVEIFDPVYGLSISATPLRIARSQHTASLLPGAKVLMLGGSYALGPGYCAPETYLVPAR